METKPSIKTSEFWIHAALQLFLLLDTLHVYTYVPAKWSSLLQGIIAAAYMASRGIAKAGTPATPVAPASSTDPATFPAE